MFLEWMGELPYKGLPWEEFQKNLSHNHQREKLLSAIVDIQREYQDVYAQISVIESEHEALTARVPEAWRARVVEITAGDDGEIGKAVAA
ncbi:MAG: hypothetical protein LCI00_16990 [Chloroflexi bacterium]|nr:hypothetical protein [Chloroflexota bacterium]